MRPMGLGKKLMLVVIFYFLISGCGGVGLPSSYVHPNFNVSFYERIAVLPFNNFTRSQFADSRVRELVLSELLLTGIFNVLEPGFVDRALVKLNIAKPTSLTEEEIKKLGKELKVQGLVAGAVEVYEEHRFGGTVVPEVSVEIRMIDTETAITVWSVAVTEGGVRLGTQLLGLRPPTISEATRTVVRRAVDTLFF